MSAAAVRDVFVLGDSISVHYGPHLARLLGDRIAYTTKGGEADALRDLDVPAGQNAGDSASALAYLRWRLANSPITSDLVLFNCGLHDIRVGGAGGERLVPIDRYRDNLGEIVATVRAMGPEPIWMRTTPFDEAVHNARDVGFRRFAADGAAYAAAADEVMAQARVPILDLHGATLALGPDLYCDHVHFQPHVRLGQAAFIAGWVLGRDDARRSLAAAQAH